MSRHIAAAAIRGSHGIVAQAAEALENAIASKGEGFKIEWPDTAFYLPHIHGMTGMKIETLGQMREGLAYAKGMLTPIPAEHEYLPYLGETLDAGQATLFAEEILLACRFAMGLEPVVEKIDGNDFTYNGFITDTILRDLGIQLVDGTMPGFAVIIGKAPDDETAVEICRDLQQRNILTFLCGNVDGDSVTKQLLRKGVDLGWDARLVPLGPETYHALYAAHWACRGALTFGGKKGGDALSVLKYNKDRVFAFAMVMGPMNDLIWSTGAGAITYGFPAILDSVEPEIRPTGVCTYEHVVSQTDHKKLVDTCIETRGLKITITKVPVPVAYGPAFEGERIRKEDTIFEFGGQKTASFEWVTAKEMDQIEDGKIELVASAETLAKIDAAAPGTTLRLPLGLVIEVAGRKMHPDFEPVIERKLHDYINCAQGVWHMGQRDVNWIRISNQAFGEGFRIKHLGDIMYAMVKSKFPAIVDKVAVKLILDDDKVNEALAAAQKVYVERNQRVANMTDESVDVFYSCLLCQSFAPNHLCVISPERLGLCGAYNWLDARAAFEIDPTGPNQPVTKGETTDPVKGRWKGVDEYVWQGSHQTLDGFSAYSIMDAPMTSCGCFECIVALVPEANGFMIVNRGYAGMTPIGMKFSTLAGTVGGGTQTPGFGGIGKYFITSRKFLKADGGFKRIVWMPKSLKEALREDFIKRSEEEGVPGFMDMVCDESIAEDSDAMMEHLTKVNHPALSMESIL
ncbi:MAG: CO dehydrogenase/CO-methylating acetyl-CoA synthase complex subunit beta [Nitrospirae bacterium]|nr:CO dehydrogenase/CO-methylating acetyl-CoA synthase complex subunit beta [Nitrospirota bacterium]